MRRILFSLLVVGLVGAAVVGASNAFFNDEEASVDNVLEAGAIDLEIDNESYYNGEPGHEGVMWPIARTSWEYGQETGLFFDFHDLKPGDLGEDTVSIHLTSNPAWVCVDLDITANDDVTCTEPEGADDPNCAVPGEGLGELADELNFIFWEDDGDNVLEIGEQVLTHGPASAVLGGVTWAIADSSNGGQPMQPGDYFIGKAWCFGTLEPNPVGDNTLDRSPLVDPGVTCDGGPVDNAAQTDRLMADVVFRAVQARHNDNFVCEPVAR